MKNLLFVVFVFLSSSLLLLAHDEGWSGTPIDVTDHFLRNSNFEHEKQSLSFGAKIYAWVTPFTWQNNNGSNFKNLQVGYAEKWCDSSGTLEDMSLLQKVMLPAGTYEFSVDAWAIRQGQETSLSITGCYFVVGDEKVAVNSGISNTDKHYATSMTFDRDTAILIGAEITNTNANWVAFDNFSLVRDMVDEADEEQFYAWLDTQEDNNDAAFENQIVFRRKLEQLSRAVVAVPALNGSGNLVSWRLLATDNDSDAFNVYRSGVKLNNESISNRTNYVDAGGNASSIYKVARVADEKEIETKAEKLIVID